MTMTIYFGQNHSSWILTLSGRGVGLIHRICNPSTLIYHPIFFWFMICVLNILLWWHLLLYSKTNLVLGIIINQNSGRVLFNGELLLDYWYRLSMEKVGKCKFKTGNKVIKISTQSIFWIKSQIHKIWIWMNKF